MSEVNFVSLTTFYAIVVKFAIEMKKSGEIYKEIEERFSFLSDVPYNVTSSTNIDRYSQCCQKLIDTSTVISQLSFRRFIYACAICSVQQKLSNQDSFTLNFIK